ncbi:MAG: 7-cyano-7-deazaguanine synthase [Acidobacteria bacterium]|nr:MAG: 7-cyano-7-deazaguanine synthase [Acidobacteriota bacterium]REK01668.1 MAG: 7-cyano-7-deazaguanine synthase [Acidobacteriota bacterium]REK14624.1 MAG: 7-cyano-7-deazaguanine synthase [Acidobacteriota bacterium]REK45339.1 MAG: 7-cyano-7-deazaguanine synthase [Acidobacteriota bacterium]
MGIVTLVSGGFDSTLMSLMAQEEGVELFPLFVDYGQLGVEKEWDACKRLHEKHGLPSVTRTDLSGFGNTIPSGITNPRLRINEDAFLPGRNLLFVLIGAAYAFKVHANSIALGLIDPSQHLFPDQTREFAEACEAMIETAIGARIQVLTPLIEFSKRDILAMAEARGLTGTYSCHAGGDRACGVCIACVEIANAKKRR